MTRIPRLVPLAVLGVLGAGCPGAPSDTRQRPSEALAPEPLAPAVEEIASAEDCRVALGGPMISGEILQRETAQREACDGDECPVRTLGMLKSGAFFGSTCDEVRKNISSHPIVDAWGAQARVVCNGSVAQAWSAGRDGKLGTCDDLGTTISVGAPVRR